MRAVVEVGVVVDVEDAAVAVVMDLPVTVRIVETVAIVATVESVESVEMVRPAVDVVMDPAVAAVEDLVAVEPAGARKNSAWTRRPSHPWARF